MNTQKQNMKKQLKKELEKVRFNACLINGC